MVRLMLRVSHHWRPMLVVVTLFLGLLLSGSVWTSRSTAQIDASPSPSYFPTASGRHFYLTNASFTTDQVLTACAAGYHAASLWEILDVSNLTYDYNHPAAYNKADSGYGPPSGWYGWVRTGYDSSGSPTTGSGNCNTWSTTSSGVSGVSVRLSNSWEAAPGDISTWDATSFTCNFSGPVWCVGNFYVTHLPLTQKSFNTLAFDFQFNGNANGWGTVAGSWFQGVKDISTEGDDGLWSSIAYNTSFSTLEYQARMIRFGDANSANNLVIRGTPNPLQPNRRWNSYYSFQYTNSGLFSVFKNVGGTSTPLQAWAASPAIAQGNAWNILKVIAADSSLYFYINGRLVWSGTDVDLSTGRVGISMYRPSPGVGDLLKVDWAKLYIYSGNLVTDQVSPEQQALNDAANLAGASDEITLPVKSI